MKIIDGTFTLNLGFDFELSEDQKKYTESILSDIDLTTKKGTEVLTEKVTQLPIDKQLYVIFEILDSLYSLAPETRVIEILEKTTNEDFSTKKKRKTVTVEKYPELFRIVEMKNYNLEQFLAQVELNKFRNFVMECVDSVDDNGKTIKRDFSKYEKEFGIKINITE